MKTRTRHYPVSVRKHTFASAAVTEHCPEPCVEKRVPLTYRLQSVMEDAGQELKSGNVKAGTEAEASRNDAY